jgi:integrase
MTSTKAKGGLTNVGQDRWKCRIKMVDPTRADRIIDTERIFAAKGIREARAKRLELVAELRGEGPNKAPRISLAKFAADWYLAREKKLKHSTKCRYTELLQIICKGVPAAKAEGGRPAKPGFAGLGDVYIDTLTPTHITRFIHDAAKRFGGFTVGSILRTLKAVTRAAQRQYDLPRWCADGIENPLPLPRYTSDEPNALTPAELAAVWEDFRQHEPRWFARVAVSAFTGFRPGEVSALQWGDLDLDTGMVRVRRRVYRGVVELPKTANSHREAVLPVAVVELLRPLAAGKPPDAWVFPSTVGKPAPDGALKEPLDRVCKRLGITKRITPYAFRRTFNTQGQGIVPDAILRKVVGHSNALMTEHYTAPDLAMRRQLGEGVFGKVFATNGGGKVGKHEAPIPPPSTLPSEQPATSN